MTEIYAFVLWIGVLRIYVSEDEGRYLYEYEKRRVRIPARREREAVHAVI
jgi:hypothetical protein